MKNTENNDTFRESAGPAIGDEKTEKAEKKGRGCLFLVIVFGVLCVLALGALILLVIGLGFLSGISGSFNTASARTAKYPEQRMSGPIFADSKIAVIDVSGMITNFEGGIMDLANADVICGQLEQAQEDKSVKAVILRMETPGGEVTASDMIHNAVLDLRSSGKVVVASMGAVSASGGYYIAAACDHIVAHRMTITGSIGVIMRTFNYHQLLQKIGVQSEVYKSGKMKDLLSGSRPRTEAEKKLAEEMVREIYGEFVRIVAEGRPEITEETIRNTQIGDGRIFSGRQAKELKLVDSLGFFDDAVRKAAELSGTRAGSYSVVRYYQYMGFGEIFRRMSAGKDKLKIEIGPDSVSANLRPGMFYFLPSAQFDGMSAVPLE